MNRIFSLNFKRLYRLGNVGFLTAVVAVGLVLAPEKSWAWCSAQNINMSFPSTLVIQRDVEVGDVLASVTQMTTVRCDSIGATLPHWGWDVGLDQANNELGPSDVSAVRLTNYPGIGLRWVSGLSGSGQSVISDDRFNEVNRVRGFPLDGIRTLTETFELVKVGPIAPGVFNLDTMRYAYANLDNSRQVLFGISSSSIVVAPILACDLLSTDLLVPMGDVGNTRFNGPGTSAGGKDFNIRLDCDAGARVNITINATADGSGYPGTMVLDSLGSSHVARDIGIRLLKGGAPVTLNTPMVVGTAGSEGDLLIPMSAEYVQTGPDIGAGQANGSATFTMTYN